MNRIAFTTLGCKVNWTDTEAILQSCRRAGWAVVPFEETADVYVINTCTVTAVADQQSKQMLRRARRRNPEAKIIASGCLGETDGPGLRSMEEVDYVFGTSNRGELIWLLNEQLRPKNETAESDFPSSRQSRARAFVKIQEGCNRSCAYCVVPLARGKSWSVPLEEVAQSCVELSLHHREIVLTGIDIGQYGRDLGGKSLLDLLGRLISLENISRLRISSLDPTMIDDGFVDILADSGRMCRHVHLSIQSCSDFVLKGMKRNYSGRDVVIAVEKLVYGIPDVAVTGDIIVGFPGEDEREFQRTLDTISSLPMANLHVFPFSPRSGTKAHSMPNRIPRVDIKKRAACLRNVAAKLRADYLTGLVGRDFDVIVTSKGPDKYNLVEAFSDNAVSMLLPEGEVEYGNMARAIITDVEDNEVYGLWH